MGETLVGGLEVIKNMKDETVAFEVGRISPTRLRNVAKAYAWWIAKDSLTLGILKVIVGVNILRYLTRQILYSPSILRHSSRRH